MSKIKLFNQNYSINIKYINEFLNKYIIYCRIFPLYIKHLVKNEQNLQEAEEKYGLLYEVYASVKNNKNNILLKSIAKDYLNNKRKKY